MLVLTSYVQNGFSVSPGSDIPGREAGALARASAVSWPFRVDRPRGAERERRQLRRGVVRLSRERQFNVV